MIKTLAAFGLALVVLQPPLPQLPTPLWSPGSQDCNQAGGNASCTMTFSGGNVVTINGSTGIKLASNFAYAWSSTTDSTGAADTQITRPLSAEISFGTTPVLFAALGTPANGAFAYCSNCTIANPCAGGGTGAFAKRLNGVWVCN